MSESLPDTAPAVSLPKFLWRIFKVVVIWLFVNLIIFGIVSFIAFSLLNALGMTDPDEAFTLAVICAIPAALTVSSLVAGRKLIHMVRRQYSD